MTPVPLGQIAFRGRHHRSALWWLGLLYRRPGQFHEALTGLPRWNQAKAGVTLYLHFLLYLVIICVLGKVFLFGLLELPLETYSSAPPV